MLFTLVALAAVAATSIAAPFREPYVMHEKRDSLLKTKRSQKVDKNAILPVRIGLRQRNLEHGYSYLMDVSSSTSPNYGRHWTAEEVHSMFAPSEDSTKAVKEWLVSFGISETEVVETANKGWLAVNVPTWKAEEMFKTTYYEHETISDGTTRLGCDHYHLPERLASHVDYIRPGISLSPPIKKRTISRRTPSSTTPHKRRSRLMPRYANTTELQNCGTAITPTCLRALYNIPEASGSDDSNALGIYENAGDIYSQDDLNKFFAKYALNVPQGTHPSYNGIDGAPQPVQSGSPLVTGESDVDFSIAYSLIYPQNIILYQVQEESPQATQQQLNSEYTPFVDLLDAVDGSFCTDLDKSSGLQCGIVGLTKVISLSYSTPELGLAEAAADRTCNEFMKLSLQGTTFVFASGDYGVATNPLGTGGGNGCVDRNAINSTTTVNGDVFSPQFPNTCPYVLSVGATMLTANQTVDDPESAMLVSDVGEGTAVFSTGGGFSNYVPMPDYQSDAVSSYLENYAPDYPYYTYSGPGSIQSSSGVYNRAGRGIPDVSANGVNFMTFVGGENVPMDGTSLSAPIWASMLTLINQERTKQGKSSVGFVNSVLYENTGIFNDITSGKNPGCGTDGFPAAPGWDPATGLGTPDYNKMLEVFLSLP